MKTLLNYLAVLLLPIASATGQTAEQPAPAKVEFSEVKQLLSDRCFNCHGPDEGTREADLRLDTKDGALQAITPGDPEDSELFLRVMSEDDPMPPVDSNLTLSASEKQLLKRWINEGAEWEQHWSFVPPKQIEPPESETPSWNTNPIDRFVHAKLIQHGMSPATRASREKLLRRISFDLTGLPPTLTELDHFLADTRPDALERAVDQLLDSPRYGERMTADWLDVARYSDTYGYQVDRDRFVWPWRDWVVRAFNQNMPYDQFVKEQIAGDLIPNATDDQILATTFNRLHPQKVEGGSVEEEFRVEYVADRAQTFGMAFLGLTVECARCHDHKYDPFSQKEYYQLFAYFNSIDESGLYSYFDAAAIPSPSMLLLDDQQKKKLQELEDKVRACEAALSEHMKQFKTGLDHPENGVANGVVPPKADYVADFEKVGRAGNQLIEGPNSKAIEFTGDDEIRLEAGDFKRHSAFTVSTRLWIPENETILDRSVIYHRTRAWTDSASRGYQLLVKKGKLSASLIHFWPGNAISVETTKPVPTNQWIHVSFAYDGSSRANGIQIFIDGKPVATTVVKDNLQKKIVGSGTSHLVLGARFRDIGFKAGKISELSVFHRRLSDPEIAAVSGRETEPSADLIKDFQFATNERTQTLLQELESARAERNAMIDSAKEIMVMKELSQPKQAYVLARGAYDARTDKVAPGTPSVLPPAKGHPQNRLGLANWLTQPNHPLTARVAVNHYWQLLVGEGLVRTPEDFGSQGQLPTHPELLDWLAVDFEKSGWDVKRLLKQIVLSQTYQQSTKVAPEILQKDPDNRLLGRAFSHRLPAEMIRDNVLFVSGLLVDKQGGAPVRPYELAQSFKPSTPDQGAGLYRRSLYTYWKRTGPAPVMLTLDAAKRDVCQVKRERTSSPLAALVQLNNPQTVEASRKLAEKLIRDHKTPSAISQNLFRTLTSRRPTAEEQDIVMKLYGAQLKYFQSSPSAQTEFLAVGASKPDPELDLTELAAWSSVANTLFSFDECVMKR